MKKSVSVLSAVFLACLVSLAEDRNNNVAGNWVLQEIEDKNGNRTIVEYGENILIFDDLLHMGCINNLRQAKKFSICDLDDYSVYAFDVQRMKLFCYGKLISDGREIPKSIVYELELLTDDKLILEYRGQKAVYCRMFVH